MEREKVETVAEEIGRFEVEEVRVQVRYPSGRKADLFLFPPEPPRETEEEIERLKMGRDALVKSYEEELAESKELRATAAKLMSEKIELKKAWNDEARKRATMAMRVGEAMRILRGEDL